jgi:hypothetical protein
MIVSALAETPVGSMLLVSPPLVPWLLLGASLEGPVAVILSRVAGSALLALSIACWLSRDDGPSLAQRGLVAALLMYNVATVAILGHAGAIVGLGGVLLWPAVALHAALAVWCGVVKGRARNV